MNSASSINVILKIDSEIATTTTAQRGHFCIILKNNP